MAEQTGAAMGEAADIAATGMNQVGENEGEEGGNWLVALAKALAQIQLKFLDAAMENIDTMNNNAEAATMKGNEGEGASAANDTTESGSADTNNKGDSNIADANKESRDKFLTAQAQYQANIQMFNMMANMTSTSLKSLGEGLTAIARKQ